MDISSIYKENKLYRLSRLARSGTPAPLVVPPVFSGVAVLYEDESAPELDANLSGLLTKVIEGGMKLDPAQVLIANTFYTDASLQKLAEQAGAKTVLIFGLSWLSGLTNTTILKNDIVKLYGMKVLVTDSLDTLYAGDQAKKALWTELKKLL